MKTIMMSPMDFYSAITPDCSLRSSAGSGNYEEVKEENLAKVRLNKSPVEKESVLNAIGEQGLLSYADFCFLISLIATPARYIDTAFNVFDVTGSESIDSKVSASTSITSSIISLSTFTGVCLCYN